MPIHDLGYRPWHGPLVPSIGRFWVIAQTGIRLAWQNRWLRRILLLSWLPAVYLAALLFAFEQWQARTPENQLVLPWLADVPLVDNRHLVWSSLLWIFFRYPQGIVMVLLIGQIAPPLIAQDVRTKAFLLYFSRPLARFEYLLGKMAIVWTYSILITTVPALALYAFGVLLSPDLRVVLSTWDLPLRIVAATAVLVIPTTAVALAISSLATQTRSATFGWFAFWALGWGAYATLVANLPAHAHSRHWQVLSMYHTLGTLQYWVFGLKESLGTALPYASEMSILPAPSEVEVGPASVQLIAITLVALGIVMRRVSSPMRI